MSKDYAKVQVKQSKPLLASMSSWVWLLIGIFFGLLIAVGISAGFYANGFTIVRLKPIIKTTASPQLAQTKQLTKQTQPQKQIKITSPKQPTTNTKPQFDFYSILPNTPTMAASSAANTPAKQNVPSTTYWLQIASFRQLTDAQQLQVDLIKQGYKALVSSRNNSNGRWFRVMIGPYLSKQKAQTDQRQLSDNIVKPLLIQKKTS